MSQNQDPQPWHKVYTGDTELRLFKAISRTSHDWRTTSGIAKEARLSEAEVEKIINKYLKTGHIIQHSSDPSKFQYFEKAKPKAKVESIAETNKKKRIEDASGGNGSSGSGSTAGNCVPRSAQSP